MPASLYRPSTTVFWPLDCRKSGYVFGWCNNNQRVQSIVVTGVAQILTLAVDLEVRAVLQRLNDKRQQYACLADLGELKILGRCGFDYCGRSDLVAPELELVGIRCVYIVSHQHYLVYVCMMHRATGYKIVYYHRHPASSLRFYSIDAAGLGIDAFNDIVTPMSIQRSGINQDVIKQVRCCLCTHRISDHKFILAQRSKHNQYCSTWAFIDNVRAECDALKLDHEPYHKKDHNPNVRFAIQRPLYVAINFFSAGSIHL